MSRPGVYLYIINNPTGLFGVYSYILIISQVCLGFIQYSHVHLTGLFGDNATQVAEVRAKIKASSRRTYA